MIKIAIPLLHISDPVRAENFYCKQLGFTKTFAYLPFGNNGPCYIGLVRDGVTIHLSSFSGDGTPANTAVLIVDHVDSLYDEFISRGVQVDLLPTDQNWGNREMYIKDADNNSLRFTQWEQHETITTATMQELLDAFNRHDLDAIMEFFSDDCSFDFPRGPQPWGQRFIGKAAVREALAGRFKGIPDVHYGEDNHWISADGNKGVSEWTLTGTTTAGVELTVRGCDLWEFGNGKISRKNSYWKIVEQ